MTQRLEPDRAAWLLAFDIAELAVLLFLTGGLQNPFAFLFLGPVLLSATALPPRFTLMLGGFAVACATVLVFVHYPLPWDSEDPLQLPPIYMMGVWMCILLAIGFIGVYAWQITEESRQLSDALAATELVLAREQHLSQLDGLAAAAAHELGTPLSTISVIAKELERAIAPNAPHGDDVRLLARAGQRCRDILAKLTELSAGGEPFDRMPLTALIEEVVAPHRNFGVDHRRDRAARSRRRAGRRAQSGHPLRARQSAGKCGRFRARPGFGRCAVERGLRCALRSATMVRDLHRKYWPESANLMSPAAGITRTIPAKNPPAWASASLSPRRCSSARVPRYRLKIGPFRSVARLSGCIGAAAISSDR